MAAATARAQAPRDTHNGHETTVAVEITATMMKKAETLKGDIAKSILDLVRQQQKPWEKLNEGEQQAVIDRIEFLAGSLVNGAVVVMGSRGFPHYGCQIGKITLDKGIEAKITLPFDAETLSKLASKRNETVLLVPIDPRSFMGGKKLAPDVVGSLAMPKGEERADKGALDKVGRGKDEPHDPETGELPPKDEQRPSA